MSMCIPEMRVAYSRSRGWHVSILSPGQGSTKVEFGTPIRSIFDLAKRLVLVMCLSSAARIDYMQPLTATLAF